MVGLHDSTDAVFHVFNAPHGVLHSGRSVSSLARSVAIRTASVFAQSDLFIASLAWNASGKATPNRYQDQMKEGIERIAADARVGQVQDDAEASSKVLKHSAAIEVMVKSQKPLEKMFYHTEDEDFSESNLDVSVALDDTVRNGLQIFLRALLHQLQCCEKGHSLRLRLSGFINQVDAQSRLFFDAYLSTQYIWTPPSWVQSRCIIAR
jgi:hypothetical protein